MFKRVRLPMYRLTASSTADRASWNQALQRLHGSPFHTHEWSLYSAENKGCSTLYFQLSDSSNAIVAMAHGTVATRLSDKIPLFITLSFGSLPAYKDADALNAMIRQIQSHAGGEGYMSVEWNSFGSPGACRLCNCLPTGGNKRWEFLVDLNGSEEALWKRLHSKKRNMINKAAKSGLRIERAESAAQIRRYRELAIKTWQRKKKQGIRFPAPPAEPQFERMKRRLIDTGIGRMYLAYHGPVPAAGAFFAGFAGTAYYVLSAADETGLKKSAPDLLIWTAMGDYLRDGCRSFNLGGVSENELNNDALEQSGLYHFKIRFSAQVQQCFKAAIVLKPARHRLWQLLAAVKTTVRK